MTGADPLLRVEDLVVRHRVPGAGPVAAVAGVSLELRAGETLGLVGESGCGKTTLARAVMMLRRPDAGRVLLSGQDLTGLPERRLRRARRRMHMVFQDPVSSLNPRRTVSELVEHGLSVAGVAGPRRPRVEAALTAVGLDPALYGDRRPRDLSGGQCQRVALARAIALEPVLLVCDEPVSALDVSHQAQIVNLLRDMRERYGLALLFIAHDLAVVKSISDRVAVMYLGTVCETGPVERLYGSPAHPYTRALLDAVPDPDRDPDPAATRASVLGEPASPAAAPSGCRFRTRCPQAQPRCAHEVPVARAVGPDHRVACHFPLLVPGGTPPAPSSDGTPVLEAH